MAKTLIVIAGPTAIGKTTLAIQLAQYYGTEIISADSRQFYREMEIGTAKPSAEELIAAKHHFINSLSISDEYNVGDFERDSIRLIEELFKSLNVLIVVGGSGLFINAIIQGFDDLPASSKEVRHELNILYEKQGISYLQEKLKQVDPTYFNEVDLNNPQRLIRALEVHEITGQPFSLFRNRIIKHRPFNIIQIGLRTDRENLYRNINLRVDLMVKNGLIEEAERLKPFRALNPLNTVGYAELFTYFDGEITFNEVIEKIKQNTRRFAKRQMTWFNKSQDIHWFEPQQITDIIAYLDSQLCHPGHEAQKS